MTPLVSKLGPNLVFHIAQFFLKKKKTIEKIGKERCKYIEALEIFRTSLHFHSAFLVVMSDPKQCSVKRNGL